MTTPLKIIVALPLIALLAGCVSGADGGINSQSELEDTLDQDIDGDGTIPQGGVEVGT
jgi:hypothetical protein